MFSIKTVSIPDSALLRNYAGDATYTDCYSTDIHEPVTLKQYVAAFYTTPVFKLERLILVIVSGSSSDLQAEQLAAGSINSFAAWKVEARTDNQLLMCDFSGRTRSWLMVESVPGNNAAHTRLYFGSAVIPAQNPVTGRLEPGRLFRALLGFHKIYSQILLYAAKSGLDAK